MTSSVRWPTYAPYSEEEVVHLDDCLRQGRLSQMAAGSLGWGMSCSATVLEHMLVARSAYSAFTFQAALGGLPMDAVGATPRIERSSLRHKTGPDHPVQVIGRKDRKCERVPDLSYHATKSGTHSALVQ